MTRFSSKSSKRPYTLAERLALAESPRARRRAPPRTPAAHQRMLRDRLGVLEDALYEFDHCLDDQLATVRSDSEDRVALRVGVVLRAREVLSARLASMTAEVRRRIALRSDAVTEVVDAWMASGGRLDLIPHERRLDAWVATAPSLPSLAGVEGDFWPDPPDPWDSDTWTEPDPEEALREELEARVRIPGARDVLELHRYEPAVLEAFAAWAEREGLLGAMSASDFAASEDQVRRHLVSYRYDLERLASSMGQHDVANGSLSVQIAWALDVGVIGPESAELIRSTSIVHPSFTGT